MRELRELRLALPGETQDIYQRHQQVWRALHGQVRHGPEFLYRMASPRMAIVRSEHIERGQTSALTQGPWRVDVVAARIVDRNKERPVPIDEIPSWATERLLIPHGIRPDAVRVDHHWIAAGIKPAREDRPAHSIAYSAARLIVEGEIADRFLAQKAWRLGIGRGRRFGFGMLTQAQPQVVR